jgi:hypothetical protein
MLKIRILLILCVFLIPLPGAFAVNRVSLGGEDGLIFSPELIAQKQPSVGINVGYLNLGIFNGGAVSTEIGLEKSAYYTGVKLGVEYFDGNLWMFSSRLNFAGYVGAGEQEFRVIPEVGLHLATLLSLSYGYGFHLSGDRIDEIGTHRLTLRLNIPF